MAIGLMTSGEAYCLAYSYLCFCIWIQASEFVVFEVFFFFHRYLVLSLLSHVPFFSCCCTLWIPAQCGGCEVTGREGLSGLPGVPKECRQIGGKDGRGSRKELEELWVCTKDWVPMRWKWVWEQGLLWAGFSQTKINAFGEAWDGEQERQ